MTFKDKLIEYTESVGCTIKELAEASGLSAAVISRYRSGERTPAAYSPQLTKLATGLSRLAAEQGSAGLTGETILSDLRSTLDPGFDSLAFSARVDYIITELNINVSTLAKALNYDASFISRIRAGHRTPSNLVLFAHKFAYYLAKTYHPAEILKMLGKQMQDLPESFDGTEQVIRQLESFLLKVAVTPPSQAENFLHKLDDFDLNEYIRSIHFDELKVPSVPFQLPSSREYRGMAGQQKGELDFLKGTVLSKSREPVFMCSDMDMSDMAKDLEFSKQWMFGLAMILKKDMAINVVHNLNRPFSELMLGLEAWIPLYMTGQVTPYYLKGMQNTIYQHLLYTSGTCALSGECIKGFHDGGRCCFTNSKDTVAYYQERASHILKRASSLMDIYTINKAEQFQAFYRLSLSTDCSRHYLSSSLPTFVLPDDMLDRVLRQNNVPEAERLRLIERNNRTKAVFETLLEKNRLLHEIPLITEEEYERHPLVLDLSEYEYGAPVPYPFADYQEHILACKAYAERHENYTLKLCDDFAFRNIQIRILEDKWVCITKIKSPMIHFVIHHPVLRDAIEKMYIPVRD